MAVLLFLFQLFAAGLFPGYNHAGEKGRMILFPDNDIRGPRSSDL